MRIHSEKRLSAFTRRFSFLLFLSFLFCISFSSVVLSDDKSINITADTLEHLSGEDLYIAEGSVSISSGDATLSADTVRYNTKTSDALASGNVLYEDPDSLIRADMVELNFQTKLGIIYNSTVFYKKDNYHLRGGDIRRLGETSYFMDRAEATTCDDTPRPWHIKGEQVSVKLNETITAKKATFYIKEFPVLYSPYFWAPLAKDRETGFLTPTIGYSSKKGFTYNQGFFWAMKDNMDLTLYGDYFEQKGFGKGMDFRYITDPATSGELWIYHLRDNDRRRDFFEVKSYHNQNLPYNMSGYLKTHLVNEFDYYTELKSTSFERIGLSSMKHNPFGFSTEERLQKYLESNLHLSKPFVGGRAYLLGQYRQSLEGSSGTIPQVLPETALVLYTRDLGMASFNMSLTATNFMRDEGQQGQRFDVYPNVFLSFGRNINFTQRVGLRETLYFLSDPAHNTNREIFDLRSTVSTRLMKRYSSFLHIVEPALEYDYIPAVDQDDIPIFDSIDTIPHTSSIGYSFTNRLAGAALGGMEARLRLSNRYNLLDVDRPFAPVLMESNLTSRNVSLNANASYDVYDQSISETITSVLFRGEKGFIGVEKNFRRSTDLDQYTFKAGVYRPITLFDVSVPANLSGEILYDMKGGGVQELNLESRYVQQCWGVGISYTRRPFEYQILFAIEFKGLGEIKFGKVEDIM